MDTPSKLISFAVGNTTPLILQSEIAECGLASLAMVASYYGYQLDMPFSKSKRNEPSTTY
ncbi:cysteine peptidase family C39 domain-containing protein [Shewanella sp. YIC-542]|uniref:cysteine peptidase family C39 domain-containing protein n=1 Tax=Shewanella mytili TaxID=3377111 RepID=UPI00398F4717